MLKYCLAVIDLTNTRSDILAPFKSVAEFLWSSAGARISSLTGLKRNLTNDPQENKCRHSVFLGLFSNYGPHISGIPCTTSKRSVTDHKEEEAYFQWIAISYPGVHDSKGELQVVDYRVLSHLNPFKST